MFPSGNSLSVAHRPSLNRNRSRGLKIAMVGPEDQTKTLFHFARAAKHCISEEISLVCDILLKYRSIQLLHNKCTSKEHPDVKHTARASIHRMLATVWSQCYNDCETSVQSSRYLNTCVLKYERRHLFVHAMWTMPALTFSKINWTRKETEKTVRNHDSL